VLTPTQVQLQTLTAIVKLFLKKPDESQAIVQRVLQAATKDCDNADVRDRAYIYWRLLTSDPAAAKVSKKLHKRHRTQPPPPPRPSAPAAGIQPCSDLT
jgi:vesicle coat complex subunit